MIMDMFPELEWDNYSDEAKERFHECAQLAWWAIDQEWIDSLIKSMPRRLAAVRKARGWQTKY